MNVMRAPLDVVEGVYGGVTGEAEELVEGAEALVSDVASAMLRAAAEAERAEGRDAASGDESAEGTPAEVEVEAEPGAVE